MQNLNEANKPLIYSCSGCSSAAQMANAIALKIDRSGLAEMSCIAGVGGNVKKLVRLAKSGRKIIAVDGCPLACAKACLANHQLKPDLHFDLSDYDVPKRAGRTTIRIKWKRCWVKSSTLSGLWLSNAM